MKKIAQKILNFIDKYVYPIPKMTCYGCIKNGCVNRSYRYNKICVGYKKRGRC